MNQLSKMAHKPLFVGLAFAAAAAVAGYALFKWLTGNRNAKAETAMAMNARFKAEIIQHLSHRRVCDDVEEIGSTFMHDGINVDECKNKITQLKWIMIHLVRKPTHVYFTAEEESYNHGHSSLRYLQQERELSPVYDRVLSKTTFDIRYLDTELTVDLFERELRKCIYESSQLRGKVKLIRNGRILQMDAYPDSGWLSWGPRLYRVDIIPAYQIGKELYESRPAEGYEMPNTRTWHRSFVLQEKQMLCDGAKEVLRLLEVLRKLDPGGFGNFTSYQFKTLVLHEIEAKKDMSPKMLWKRLSDVIRRLDKCLREGNLQHFFIREINLLSDLSQKDMDHLRDTVGRLPTGESELRSLLQ